MEELVEKLDRFCREQGRMLKKIPEEPMRKPVPGYRFFDCDECGHKFLLSTRDCLSPSLENCPKCFNDVFPQSYECHPEWKTDLFGNLTEEGLE